jgi:hypothetical protein
VFFDKRPFDLTVVNWRLLERVAFGFVLAIGLLEVQCRVRLQGFHYKGNEVKKKHFGETKKKTRDKVETNFQWSLSSPFSPNGS